MLGSLTARYSRYVLEQHRGEHDLGIFIAMAYLLWAGNTAILALEHSASPQLAKHYAAGNMAAFVGLLIKLVGLGALVGVAAVLVVCALGEPLLALLYRPEYGQYQDVLLWLTVGTGVTFMASFLDCGMTAARSSSPRRRCSASWH